MKIVYVQAQDFENAFPKRFRQGSKFPEFFATTSIHKSHKIRYLLTYSGNVVYISSMGTKRDAFKRLATARVNKAIDSIRLVGNLSNKANYEYSAEDAEKIVDALRASVQECKKKFELAGKAELAETFRLD
ncbi:MAG TPA: hypothetical protein VG944_16850 [Fimbriimonas sp.]|nr:hypothetical protein [Fimbriimonas sp.]